MLDRRTVSMTRTIMRISQPLTKLAALVAGIVLLSGVAQATLAGVVTAISKRDITVSGAVYPLEAGVEVQDMTGHPITRPELRPGVAVELEFDEEGRLSLIRAAVVR
jgi:hypothetical protein